MKVLITGGGGLLATELSKSNTGHELVVLNRRAFDTSVYSNCMCELILHEPDVFIHCGAMTTPMSDHDQYPGRSIMQNITGTANVASSCYERNVKPVYISTDYVYKGEPRNNGYHESDSVYPVNNYGWSKLGGECAMKMVPDSLILRCSFTARPFRHDKAFTNSFKSFMYVDEIAPLIWKLIDKGCTGVYNVGGKPQSIYAFAVTSKPDVVPVNKDTVDEFIPYDTSLNVRKLKQELHD